MLAKLSEWLICGPMADVPNHEFVIVATWCEHSLVVGAPSEPTDLLSVPPQMFNEVRLGSHISHEDLLVLGPTGYHAVWPSTGTNTVWMASHRSDKLLFLYVPNLYLTIISADTQMGAFLRPCYWGDSISFTKINQLADWGSVCIPDVHMLSEGDCKRI